MLIELFNFFAVWKSLRWIGMYRNSCVWAFWFWFGPISISFINTKNILFIWRSQHWYSLYFWSDFTVSFFQLILYIVLLHVMQLFVQSFVNLYLTHYISLFLPHFFVLSFLHLLLQSNSIFNFQPFFSFEFLFGYFFEVVRWLHVKSL